MPAKLERCINDVMKKNPKLKKSSAWAICRASLKVSENVVEAEKTELDDFFLGLELDDIKLDDYLYNVMKFATAIDFAKKVKTIDGARMADRHLHRLFSFVDQLEGVLDGSVKFKVTKDTIKKSHTANTKKIFDLKGSHYYYDDELDNSLSKDLLKKSDGYKDEADKEAKQDLPRDYYYDEGELHRYHLDLEEVIEFKDKKDDKPVVRDIEILRTGKFSHPLYKIVNITTGLFDNFINNFKSNVLGRELSFDLTHDPDKGATGWVKKLYYKANKLKGHSLYATVEFTKLGLNAVKDKIFKHFSSEYVKDFKDKESGKRYGPTLTGGGFTNRPFIPHMAAMEFSEDEKKVIDFSDDYLENEVSLNNNKEEPKKVSIFLELLKHPDYDHAYDTEAYNLAQRKLDPKAKIRNRGDVVFPAGSSSVKDKKDHYPINSEAQARNALARAGQTGGKPPSWYTGSYESFRRKVISAVRSKYPGIKVTPIKKLDDLFPKEDTVAIEVKKFDKIEDANAYIEKVAGEANTKEEELVAQVDGLTSKLDDTGKELAGKIDVAKLKEELDKEEVAFDTWLASPEHKDGENIPEDKKLVFGKVCPKGDSQKKKEKEEKTKMAELPEDVKTKLAEFDTMSKTMKVLDEKVQTLTVSNKENELEKTKAKLLSEGYSPATVDIYMGIKKAEMEGKTEVELADEKGDVEKLTLADASMRLAQKMSKVSTSEDSANHTDSLKNKKRVTAEDIEKYAADNKIEYAEAMVKMEGEGYILDAFGDEKDKVETL